MHPISRYLTFTRNASKFLQKPGSLTLLGLMRSQHSQSTDVSQISNQSGSQEPASDQSSEISSSSDPSTQIGSSDETMSVLSVESHSSLKTDSTSPSSSTKSNHSSKKVDFAKTASVILIPKRAEYDEAGIASKLWWSEVEQQSFKHSAAQEAMEYIDRNKLSIKLEDAHRLLCQSEADIDSDETTLRMRPT